MRMKNNPTNITSEGASKKLVPELRFPEFVNEGEWEIVILGDIFERVTDKNKENCQNVVTISAQHGLVSQYDYFNKNVAAANVTNYYLIEKGDFAYNKSRSQGYPFGAIKQLRYYDKGVVSTLYICFRLIDNNGIKDFYDQYFETPLINSEIGKLAQEGARNHGLLNISTEDFFDKISLFIPSQIEQQKIAQCLSSLDELIAATKEKVELLKEHKRGLMQKLFPVKGKTLPELRFPEFKNEGEWEEVYLGDVFTERNESNCTSLPLLSIGQDGVYPQSESNKRDISNKDKSKYKRICPNDIGYNTMRMWQGRSALSQIEGIVSPAYTIITPKKGLDPLFLSILLKLPYMVRDFHSHSQGLVNDTLNCKFNDFAKVKAKIPTLMEQQKIATILSSLDDEIEQYSEKVKALELHKKGLMQKLFPKKL